MAESTESADFETPDLLGPGSTVADAVTRDLTALAKVSPELATGALAATAMSLARQIDLAANATASSNAANALLNTLEQIRDLAPPERKANALDDLASRRALRLDRRPGTAG